MKLSKSSIAAQNSQKSTVSLPRKVGLKSPALFPVFLKLAGRPCLVVGAGAVAQEKIDGLLAAGAEVTVVAPRATDTVHDWSEAGEIRWEARTFAPADLDGVFLVVAATSAREVNQQVFQEAQRRRVLINTVDDPPRCDFYYGSVVRRGALQIAISTDGNSPALAQRLRCDLAQKYGPEYKEWLEELGRERRRLFGTEMDAEQRRQLLHTMAGRKSYEDFVRRCQNGEDRR
ncbi:MAG: precorrin-2 dehydrogenase/sirohydrochlorin ferrochelatase family protein [Terriglobia bacterium]